VALVLLVVYSSMSLSRLVINPLGRVAGAMGEVQKGDLRQTLLVDRQDEIGKLAGTFNYMVEGLREQERLRDAFNKYVSEKVYAKFRDGSLTLTGETREATILFSDIRSFTTLSEQLSAPEVVEMLNEYFSRMVDIVLKHDGFINKFIGDALMAIYNVPVDQDEPELRAVNTGIEMMAALDLLNHERKERGMFPIHIGIGINTGPVVAGNIGHQQRLEYTVIGDAVNLASRIESQTKVAGATLLISESTYRKVASHVVAEALPPVKVKGKAEPVPLYAIKGLRATEQKRAAALPAPPPAVA
jgi:adenylate cyclase